MKKLIYTTVLTLGVLYVNAQDINPFQSIGKPGKILTLSKGKYTEVHINDSLQRIGSVIVNMNTGKIHEMLDADSLYASNTIIDPTVMTRWYSPDPLSSKYPHQSPYSFVGNNPILHIENDGRDYGVYIDHDKKTITIKATYYTAKTDKVSHASAVKAVEFWNGQSGKYQYVVGQGDNLVQYEVNFDLKVLEVDDPNQQAQIDRIPDEMALNAGLTKLTPDKSSNTYSILPDSDEKFEKQVFEKERKGITTAGSKISVKESYKDEDTGAHEVGHTIGLNHKIKGLLTAASNIASHSKTIDAGYIKSIFRNTYMQDKEVGKASLQVTGEAPTNFNEGQFIEKKQ